MHRRAVALAVMVIALNACTPTSQQTESVPAVAACDAQTIRADDRERILHKADAYLDAKPHTVTDDISALSPGGPNDFFSQGDYWWPVPGQPDAPYERRDGQSNPDNFVAHRLSMIRLSDITASLASAYELTGEARYADAAAQHLRAWFVTPETRMTPALLHGQVIIGRNTGRGIGIIDTLHLVEVARAAKILGRADALPEDVLAGTRAWFADYADWMNTHPFGIKERDWHNNHAIAWGLQAAAFADFTDDAELMAFVRDRFRTVWLPDMMDADGSFPDELGRTKPYGYSLFVIDLLAGVAQIASTPEDDLWNFTLEDGRGLRRGVEFITPFVEDKASWSYGRDVAYWEEWPVRHAALVFAAQAYGDCRYYAAVADRPADSDVYEVTRNFPLRHPVLWLRD